MNKVMVAVVAVLILGAALIWVYFSSNKPPTTTTSTSQSTQSSTTGSTSPTPTVAATIVYDGSSFSPSSVSVKSGDKVTFTNNSQSTVQVNSNPHPFHTDDSDLNVGTISPGQSMTVTLSKTGSFRYHNHLNPSQGGAVTVN